MLGLGPLHEPPHCYESVHPLLGECMREIPHDEAFYGWGLSNRPHSRAGCVPSNAGFSCSVAACVALETPSSSSLGDGFTQEETHT